MLVRRRREDAAGDTGAVGDENGAARQADERRLIEQTEHLDHFVGKIGVGIDAHQRRHVGGDGVSAAVADGGGSERRHCCGVQQTHG
jgi:hypothetical protein